MTNLEDKINKRLQEHDPYYRLGVGVMILNASNQVLICKRLDMADSKSDSAWQMPQGGVDVDEDPLKAALREMIEEIGTDKVELIAESKEWFSYNLPDNLAGKLWGGRFAGQKQKWFLFRFLGTDQDINLHTKHPEFCEWRWIKPQELPNIIVEFKREVYQKLLEEFSDHLS